MSSRSQPVLRTVAQPDIYGIRQRSGLVIGPALLAATLLLPPPERLSVEAWRTAGVELLMAMLWIAESIPIPVTALLPLVLLPALHLGDIRQASAPFLPITAAVAIGMHQNPLLLLIPTALAANCSYMLPVGTPPNAIVFGSGRITLPQMARAGLWLNLAPVPIIAIVVLLLGRWVFDIAPGVLPPWVK